MMGHRLLVVMLFLTVCAAPTIAQDKSKDWAETFINSEHDNDRIKAGLMLAQRDPDALARALDQIVKDKDATGEDTSIVATVAVRTKVRHIRYLLVWAASKMPTPGDAFREMIDNDHPWETLRALEALGLLRDKNSIETLVLQLKNQDELIAIQAARTLSRMGDKKLSKRLVEIALGSDNKYVRLHLAWAVQDLVGSRKGAIGAFARYKRKKGTVGYRAKEAVASLEDELADPTKYKVKLEDVRDLFAKKGGTKTPPIDGPTENQDMIKKVLKQMKEEQPDYWHLIAATCKKITVSGNEQMFDWNASVLNLRFRDLASWDVGKEEVTHQNLKYYLIRYATILFTGGRMGEPQEGQRAWEKGIMDCWQFAMDFTKIAVEENPVDEYHRVVNQRPSPW